LIGRALPLLLLLLACTRSSVEARFWKWFVAHKDAVATIRHANEPIANELAVELRKVHPRLVFEMGLGTPKELIISASGERDGFPAVKRLVAAAPAIPGWVVIAFRPRKPNTELQ
jgi:hypothetical protein